MKSIKVPLSNQGLNDLLQKVNNFKNDLKEAETKIVEKMADYTLEQIQNNFSSTTYKDGNDDVAFFKRGTDNKKTVGAMGTQVLYDEFGTGEEGAKDGHEMKGDFRLKPYNSGKTIRPNNNPNSTASQLGIPLGTKYWTYKVGDIKKYTTGIPAGKQVFNASISLKNKKMQIIKKEVSDVLSKL